MKKILIGAAIGVVLFTIFGAAGYAFARFTHPDYGYLGYGMMGSRGEMMNNRFDRYDRNDDQYNSEDMTKLHESMISAFADKLGISSSDLESRLSKGETLTSIASSKGIDSTKLDTLLDEAFAGTLDQAVKDGTLTQTQADWMKQRGGGMMLGYGRGSWSTGGRNCPMWDFDRD